MFNGQCSMVNGQSKKHPVLEHLSPIGGQHALRMELYAADVQFTMAQGHDLSLV